MTKKEGHKFFMFTYIMSKYKSKKIIPQTLLNNNNYYYYYDNVLVSLGLSKFYILFNNYLYFGTKEISNQDTIKRKFENIEQIYNSFLDKIYNKYNSETLTLELGTIYTKLQKIYLSNNDVLGNNIKDKETIKNIAYPAKVADLMARKVKTLTEIVITKDNHKLDFPFSNYDYRKLIILLYYYSTYIFYSSRSRLSKDYENGISKFYIFPTSLEPICTNIPGQENSTNDNRLYFNYNSGIGETTNKDFNNSFLVEKGITFENYTNFMQLIINSLNTQGIINGKIEKPKLFNILKDNYSTINLDRFKKECVLTKNSFEANEKDLFKNNCKHRLDTTPIININDKYYILNKGFIWNSKNFWNNVHSTGLTPYISDKKDKILISSKKIVSNITSLFEKDIIKVFKSINNNIDIRHNKKSKDIFKNKNIGDNEWDIIVIDHKNKYIFDVEAKFLSTSMTESGLSNDLKKLIGKSAKNYKNKFEKRIDIENSNKQEFLNFCRADESYKIIHIMVTSKVVSLNIESVNRNFLIIHYEGLEKYILNTFFNKK